MAGRGIQNSGYARPISECFCGIKVIGSYIQNYNDYGLALMAYNMGDYGAKKAWENGIKSTSYSESVLALMQSMNRR